ncbi:MAG: acyltransferase family protein [Planctomycetaceae bacterium]|jgi:peptidoglycan/LPS O-acetylase OafA/YrhL|nr:acyltransferase family protein [Planctomycetaceae bacterium]
MSSSPESFPRRHDLDALRAIAMLLGIALHGLLAYTGFPWAVQDVNQAPWLGSVFAMIHGFRMPLFFLVSGFFTAMLWRKRGLQSLMRHRFFRIFVPCMVGLITVIPTMNWVSAMVVRQSVVLKKEVSADADIWWAAVFGDVAALKRILKSGVDIDARDQERQSTALIVAASVGQTKAVEFLIAEGADLFYRNLDNTTALDVARLSQHHKVVVILEAAMQQAKAGTSASPIPAEPDNPDSCEVWAEGDLFDAIKRGDHELVGQLLAQGADPGQRRDTATALSMASIFGHPQVATLLLEAGADVNARNEDGGTALHGAVFFGRVDVVRVLMDHQVDVTIRNNLGEKATDFVTRPFTKELGGAVDYIAALMTIDVRQSDVRKSLPEMAAVLKVEAGGGKDEEEIPSLTDVYWWIVFGEFWNVKSGFHAMLTPVFHHLWFLWFLCWLVVGFAVYAMFAKLVGLESLPNLLIVSPLRYLWLVPVTIIPQAFMGDGFGPDTSVGLIPYPHLLFYYAIFFGFGALYFDCKDTQGKLGSRWFVTLPVALLLFLIGAGIETGDAGIFEGIPKLLQKTISVVIQVLYVWLMTFGLIGLFRKMMSSENKWMRYISDSSYWLYLAHLPLMIWLQWLISDWDLDGTLKFVLVCTICTAVLLLMYEYLVRYTPIGTMLNGKKVRGSG